MRVGIAFVTALFLFKASAFSQQPPVVSPSGRQPVVERTLLLVTHRLPAALAHEAVDEAVGVCAKQGYAVTAVVVNVDGVRVALLSGDGAGLHTQETAYGKAYAAFSLAPMFKVDGSGSLAEKLQPAGAPPFQAPTNMVLRAGGLTIKFGDEVIGAIGVGGAPGAHLDEVCAHAGLNKIRGRIR
jgi:uncharacterized protein GlcG (DUF336 family)